MAGARGEWSGSLVTREGLEDYVRLGLLPPFTKCEWRAPDAKEKEPRPRAGERVVFTSFLERGLSLPASDFVRSFFGLQLHHLSPNSILQLSCFVALSRDTWASGRTSGYGADSST